MSSILIGIANLPFRKYKSPVEPVKRSSAGGHGVYGYIRNGAQAVLRWHVDIGQMMLQIRAVGL